MTPEQLLFSGLSAVTAALVWTNMQFWARLSAAENTIRELRMALELSIGEAATNKAKAEFFMNCPKKDCPFQVKPHNA